MIRGFITDVRGRGNVTTSSGRGINFEYKVIAKGLSKLQNEEKSHSLHDENKKIMAMATKLVLK